MVTATVIPDMVVGGMSVGRWLLFGVNRCVLVCFGSSRLCINIWWETPSIERSLSIRSLPVTLSLTQSDNNRQHTIQRRQRD